MTNPPSQFTQRDLLGFADAQIDPPRTEAVLRAMAADPSVSQRVLHQQQLRAMLQRTITRHTPSTPPELRQRVQALLSAPPSLASAPTPQTIAPPTRPRSPVLAYLGRWTPSIAAVLLIAAMLFWADRSQRFRPAAPDAAAVIPASLAESMARRHVACTRNIESLLADVQFPQDLREVPAAIESFFQQQPGLPALDLSSLGYEYAGAGRCILPGKSVHLIYRPLPGRQNLDTLSLWIQPTDLSPLHIQPDHLYQVTGDRSPHPMVLWRHGNSIYYLVGDAPQAVDAAARVLQAP